MTTNKFEVMEQGEVESLSCTAVARRRALLKGIGKGAAVLAATVPLQTLASQSVLTYDLQHQCSISGMFSGVHSTTTTSDTPTCLGYKPSRYATLSFWPGYNAGPPPHAVNTVDGITFDEDTSFATVFGGGSSGNSNAARLLTIVTSGSPEPEQVWVTALLNAIKNPANFNFPYTPSQVRAFYASSQAADALSFFRSYMQTVA